MSAKKSLLIAVLAVFLAVPASALELTQVVSREHPLLNVETSRMAVGRDGRVYLASNEYVLRVERDGSGKFGGKVTYALTGVAANAEGTVATSNAHFSHSVNLWSSSLAPLGAVSDFLNNDQVQWQGPSDVQAGPSGDFFGVDPNRNRVVRLSAPGRIVTTYSLAGTGESHIGHSARLRVWEPGQRLYVANEKGQVHCLDFAGKKLWTLDAGIGGNPWDGYRGAFDVDEAGVLYVVDGAGDLARRFDRDGKPAGELKLEAGRSPPGVQHMALFGDDLVLKRRSPTELFQVFDRRTGRQKRTVRADVELLRVTLPGDVWTAGQSLPLRIEFDPGSRPIRPKWRAWLAPFNVPEWRALPLADGKITVPQDAAGLCRFRLGAGGPLGGEYLVQAMVEVRAPGAKGSAVVTSPSGRLYYGRGEEVPITVIFRARPEDLPAAATLALVDDGGVAAQQTLPVLPGKNIETKLPPSLTAALRPGRYTVRVTGDRLTCVPQVLLLGPGLARPAPFSIVQHGDYAAAFNGAVQPWDAPERVAEHLNRSLKLGTNLYVDRLGHGASALDQLFWNNGNGLGLIDELYRRFEKDPLAPAPQSVRVETPWMQLIAGYGAHGIQEQGILLYMDAGLPVGTGFDQRKPEQFAEAITKVTTAMKPYPAFRGWSWAANWWLGQLGAEAAAGPEQKAAYQAALKRAQETGHWDPVLDQVSDRVLSHAPNAEKQFDDVLQRVAPGKLSVMTGPYRAVGVHPPITFQNADEVDLHYQAEQIQPPQVTPHHVDFYKRPGKRAWGHPELWNDEGTGGMILPSLLQMAMRGADGVGWSGAVPAWGSPPSDPRATGQGTVSVFRNLNALLRQYGPWLTTLRKRDPLAIVVSTRMQRIDTWSKIGGLYFDRLYEAYNACLYARRPASFVFVEDLRPETLKQYKGVLVVSQRVELDPPLAAALEEAQAAGVAVYYDGTCREELVKKFRPLGVAFDRVEKDESAWQDDAAYYRIPPQFKEHAASLDRVLGAAVPPIARCSHPEVLLSEMRSGDGRFLWVVNNTMLPLEPGLAWRVGLLMAHRLPVVATLELPAGGEAIYDVFARRRIDAKDGRIEVDLRTWPARLYAILPSPIGSFGGGFKSHSGGPRWRAGDTFRWQVQPLTSVGQEIKTGAPYRLRLLHEGQVIDERHTVMGLDAPGEEFLLPVNVAAKTPGWGPTPEQSVYFELRGEDLLAGFRSETAIWVEPPPPDQFASWKLAPPSNRHIPRAMADSTRSVSTTTGPRLKEIAVSADGATLLINAMNWNDNLYALDAKDGRVKWRSRIGHHLAYGPATCGGGFAAQGFDLNAPEGYHLYLLSPEGRAERRFALYGLPKRATSWANGSNLLDRINQFAFAPGGRWVATAGDLGLAVWDREGKLLWSRDWWKDVRKRVVLAAQDDETVLVLDGTTAAAHRATDGTAIWTLVLGNTGALQGAEMSADRRTVALRSDGEGGRVFVVRGGRLVNTLLTPADAMSLSPDGSALAVATGKELKWFSTDGGLVWSFTGDDLLRGPRISPDGSRVAAGSELGTLYLLGREGELLHARDFGALPAAAWLADGDLAVATWTGTVARLRMKDPRPPGDRWNVRLESTEGLSQFSRSENGTVPFSPDPTPTVRRAGWGNAAPQPLPLTPNLLTETNALVTALSDPPVHGDPRPWQNPLDLLRDGKPGAPPKPWLSWTDVNYIDSGWRGPLVVQVDTFRAQLRLTGITMVEDPAHPESWLRDVRLQFWDAAREQWRDGPMLLSDAAVHTHHFDKPIEAAKFRFVSTGGGTWPAGNLRLGELVFHGQTLGASHPDVVARRPRAVLFDEQETDLRCLNYPGRPFAFKYDDACSGGKSLALSAEGQTGPAYVAPFGHVVPNWDFEIVEAPQPGQYRWLQFACKTLSPATRGITLRLSESHYGGLSFAAGEPTSFEGATVARQADRPPREWQTVRIDLWAAQKKPVRIRSLWLGSQGGGAAFDQIVLGRTEADLPPKK